MASVIIEFLKNYVVQDERRNTDDREEYPAGLIKTVSRGTADHFVRKGVAKVAKPKRGRPPKNQPSVEPVAEEEKEG